MKSIKSNKKAAKAKENSTIATKTKKSMSKKKKILFSILGVFLALLIILVSYITFVIIKAPKIDTGNIYNILSESSVVYDDSEKPIDQIYSGENRTNVDYKELPDNLKNAFVSLEDKTFWKHHGFNFVRLLGAVKDSLTSGSIGGTSTITQQLARNLFLKERMSERTIRRKIIEAYYTVILENNLSKEEILAAYLNTIYLGNNSNGVQAAAQAYFSKDVKDLSLVECAALATLPQAPTEYALVKLVDLGEVDKNDPSILKNSPYGIYISNDVSKDRRSTCLKLMYDQKYISQEDYEANKAMPLKDFINPNFNSSEGASKYFSDYVISSVINDLMEKENISYDDAWEKVYKGGLKIHSTMDSQAQGVIESEFSEDSNFPEAVNIVKDSNGNILDSYGNIVLYDYYNYFDEDGVFHFTSDEATENEDGSITLFKDNRLNFYDTEVQGKKDVSIEFKNMYIREDGYLYAISGGFINIPQGSKKKDKNGNVLISKKFMKENPDFFTIREGGSVSIPSASYKLNQQVIQPQAAMTIVENSTGAIKAMVGGRNTVGRKLYNRAINPRQPGSSIKPLSVYGAAIEQGAQEIKNGTTHNFVDNKIDKQGSKFWGKFITASSLVIDEPTTINGRVWPKNAGGGYSGPQTLRTALQQSINTCAVKILMQVGFDFSAEQLKKFGITTLATEGNVNDMNAAALALGGMSKGISTLEMADAYSTFPNGGVRQDTFSYTSVVDKNGKTILSHSSGEGHKVLDPGTAFIMTDLLKSVVTNGLGSPAAIQGIAAGGKTGTTDEQFDIWFCGFTPTYSASLWIGNDINIELSSYSNIAARLWGRIMNQIPNAIAGSYPSQPGNVVNAHGEYFIKGTESPTAKAGEKKVMICEDSGLLATPSCIHLVETTYEFGTEDQIPKYYCNIHNPDVTKFPIDPSMKLEPQKPIPEDPKPDAPKPDDPNKPAEKPPILKP